MKLTANNSSRNVSGFNSPLECGLRSAVLLAQAFPQKLDIQRLVHYDYLLVHSGDVIGGPPSIHPATPHRSGELLVRRPLIEAGVKLMMSKSVIECEFSTNGISYFAGEWSLFFLDSLKTEYVESIKQRAKWVVKHFAAYKDDDLTVFIRNNWSNWGAEFEFESLVRRAEV
jgi:hypothetical protein